jgi:hypothetical protein
MLPAILTGLLAFKAVGLLSGPLENFGKTLGGLAAKTIPGISVRRPGRRSTAVSGIGTALPLVGDRSRRVHAPV